MNNNNNTSTSGGIGFTGPLTIVFIVLKLCHIIEWPWWWVLSPIWISFSIVIICLLITVVGALIWGRSRKGY